MADRDDLAGQRVLLDSIRCEGHEDSILDCPSVSDEDCFAHLENAGVVCEGESLFIIIRVIMTSYTSSILYRRHMC